MEVQNAKGAHRCKVRGNHFLVFSSNQKNGDKGSNTGKTTLFSHFYSASLQHKQISNNNSSKGCPHNQWQELPFNFHSLNSEYQVSSVASKLNLFPLFRTPLQLKQLYVVQYYYQPQFSNRLPTHQGQNSHIKVTGN